MRVDQLNAVQPKQYVGKKDPILEEII